MGTFLYCVSCALTLMALAIVGISAYWILFIHPDTKHRIQRRFTMRKIDGR